MLKIIFVCTIFATPAFAGFLRMASTPNLSLIEKNGQIWIEGDYTIENQGDEAAKDVYPVLHLDEWTWTFDKRSMAPKQIESWKISQKIPDDKLCQKLSENCLRILPKRGDFFIRVDKNYQDQNAYPFSTPEVLSLALGKKSPLSTATDLLVVSLKIKAIAENEFQGDYHITNKSPDKLKLGLHFLFPKEVRLHTPRLPVEINPTGNLNGTFYFTNISGLKGSDYLAMLVVEAEHQAERRMLWVPSRFKIETFSQVQVKKMFTQFSLEKTFFLLMGLLTLAGLLLVIFGWERPLRKLKNHQH